MNDHDKQTLMRIQKHISSLLKYTENCNTKNDFINNTMLVDACVFNLMQIGELAKQQLSDEFKSSTNSVPWKDIYGLRNRIVHGYEGINFNFIWDILKNDIPSLNQNILSIIKNIQ